MKNSFGNSLTITLFGESHGEYIGAVLDGLAPGIRIDEDFIKSRLALRRPDGNLSTARIEADEFSIISGRFNGFTTGTPLCILIPNTNKNSSDYGEKMDVPRPSHADFAASEKYHGFEDFRGGGHFSGRVTAAIVAAGAILQQALLGKNIKIGSHITELHGAFDRFFEDVESGTLATYLQVGEQSLFAHLTEIRRALDDLADQGGASPGAPSTNMDGGHPSERT
jgi:chorismate synthase